MKTFKCPPEMNSHVRKVLAGEYDIPISFGEDKTPSILDLGANVGSFAMWALTKWPSAVIHCYEPLESNFKFLEENLEGSNVVLNNVAVGDPRNKKLFIGKNNCGEASFFDLGEQSEESVEVVTVHPDTLPEADILKIDTEGSEVDILSRMENVNYTAIMLEFHGEDNRKRVDQILDNYTLYEMDLVRPERGVAKYIRNDAIKLMQDAKII